MKLNAVTYHCVFQTSMFNGKGFEKGQDLGPSEAGGPTTSHLSKFNPTNKNKATK